MVVLIMAQVVLNPLVVLLLVLYTHLHHQVIKGQLDQHCKVALALLAVKLAVVVAATLVAAEVGEMAVSLAVAAVVLVI
jgi:hypothetical protein